MDGEYPTDGDTGWEAIVQGEPSGPHDLTALRLLVHLGRLGPDDAVRHPGTTAWRRASTVDGLFAARRPVRAPRPPPPLPEPVIRPPSSYAAEFPDAVLPPPERVLPSWQREVVQQPVRQGSWILRHWYGELSLPISYWINTLPWNVAFIVIALQAGTLLAEQRSAVLPLAALAAFYALFVLVTLWQYIGVWRAADRAHIQAGRSLWPVVAQIMVCLGMAATAGTLALRAAPQLEDAWQQALGDPDNGARGVRILHDGTEIEISGVFARGMADSFAAALAKAPKARLVHLDSSGGRDGEALVVRDLIAERGLETYVEHQCAAACTLAYLGGTRRWLGPDAVMGFHSAEFGGIDGKPASTAMAASYAAAGVQPWFIEKAVDTPSAKLWKPTADELMSAGIVTDRAPADSFGVGGYGPAPTKEAIIARLDQTEALATLRKADGPRWAEIEQANVRMVMNGDPPAALTQLIHAHTLAAAARLRGSMPDPTALAFSPLLAREAEALQAKDPELCWRYVFKGDTEPSAALTPELAALDASAASRILADGTDHPVPAPSAADGKKLIAKALLGGKLRGPDSKRLNAALLQGKASHAAACQAFRDLLTLSDALPASEHAALLRFMLNGAK